MASGGFESLAAASLQELRKWKGDFRARELQAAEAQQVLVQLSKTAKAESKQKAGEEKAAKKKQRDEDRKAKGRRGSSGKR